jgi:hypothetical protein
MKRKGNKGKSQASRFMVADDFVIISPMGFRKDWLYLFLLLVLGIFFWGKAFPAGQVYFLRDLSVEIVPKRYFFEHASGFRLWCPYIFFGTPFAANPQSEAFYPINFFFLLFGAARGTVFYLVFHQLLFLLTCYSALRRLGFEEELSLIGSLGFGLGGFMVSLTVLPVLLSTVAWFPLLVICLDLALERGWFKWGLVLGLVLSLQVYGGEMELAVMSWGLAVGAVVFGPKVRPWKSMLVRGVPAFIWGLVWAAVLSLPQIALTLEMLPISNRGQGLTFAQSLEWGISGSTFRSLLLPNYLLPLTAGNYWGMGFFSGFPYFLSLYLGITLLGLAVCAFAGPGRGKAWFWLVLAGFGLLMMAGNLLPVYGFFFSHIPGLKFFRIPIKFLFIVNGGVVMVALWGGKMLYGRQRSFGLGAISLLAAGTAVALLLAAFPLKISELGNSHSDITNYLMLRSVLRISSLFMIVLGLILLARTDRAKILGLLIALLVFADLFFAHRLLNPATDADFYQPNSRVRELQAAYAKSITPPRIFAMFPRREDMVMSRQMDPVSFYGRLRDSFRVNWSIYFGIVNVHAASSFCPQEVEKYRRLLEGLRDFAVDLVLSRSAVEYLHIPGRGFVELSGKFSQAMIFYQAEPVPDQDQVVRIWSDPNFPARSVLLLETEEPIAPARGLLMSEPARIVEYKNELVRVEVEAREAGWLLLLDSYYPGWRAEVDGSPAEIYRANGFFRAVRVPAGKHLVSFSYFPRLFRNALVICFAGFLLWGLLLAVSLLRPNRKIASPQSQ